MQTPITNPLNRQYMRQAATVTSDVYLTCMLRPSSQPKGTHTNELSLHLVVTCSPLASATASAACRSHLAGSTYTVSYGTKHIPQLGDARRVVSLVDGCRWSARHARGSTFWSRRTWTNGAPKRRHGPTSLEHHCCFTVFFDVHLL